MHHDLRSICDAILSSYFKSRSATARAINERGGLDALQEMIPVGLSLKPAWTRDVQILKWYLSGASEKRRVLTSRRIIVLWMLEHFAKKLPMFGRRTRDPFRLPQLLRFDSHYLHTLDFTELLAEAIPNKLDPFIDSWGEDDVEPQRKKLAKEIGGIWDADRGSRTKLPSAGNLLASFFLTQRELENDAIQSHYEQVDPELRDDPEIQEAMSVDTLPYQEAQECKSLVRRARIGRYAKPADFAAAYPNVIKNKLYSSELPFVERLLLLAEDIAAYLLMKRLDDATIVLLAAIYGSTEGTVRKELNSATKSIADITLSSVHKIPPAFFLDHREWSTLDAHLESLIPGYVDRLTRTEEAMARHYFETRSDAAVREKAAEYSKTVDRKKAPYHIDLWKTVDLGGLTLDEFELLFSY